MNFSDSLGMFCGNSLKDVMSVTTMISFGFIVRYNDMASWNYINEKIYNKIRNIYDTVLKKFLFLR
jgi:hypothetical protein